MKQLGKTDLHRIVEAQTNDQWSGRGRSDAESYLLFRHHRTDLSDIAHALNPSITFSQRGYLEQIFDHPPSVVIQAFDKVRQAELDYQQGRTASN